MSQDLRNENKAPCLSVVTPVFNEAPLVDELIERIHKSLRIQTENYEIICIDDGSQDETLSLLKKKAHLDRRLKILSLSRNFGHQFALSAGLEYAGGEAVILIDSDLQDPPEVIPQLVEKWKEGYDVVYAVRKKRPGESWFKLLTAHLFYRIINHLTPFRIPLDTGDFRLISHRVANILMSMPERQRFIRGMISWIGFRQAGVFYERDPRKAGRTKFSTRKMLKFSVDGIASFSYFPLQLASYLGMACAVFSFLFIVFALYAKYFMGETIRGWTSTIITVLFLGGIQLLMMGVLGEYIGRIYEDLKKRPLFVIKNKINLNNEPQAKPEKAG